MEATVRLFLKASRLNPFFFVSSLCMTKKRILVIEDNLSNSEMIDAVLTEDGYLTKCLSSSAGLAEMLTDFVPDLVLMDLLLEGADGRELCNFIKAEADEPRPKVILMTAALLHQIPEIPCHPDVIITKPFDIFSLSANIRQLLICQEDADDQREDQDRP
ncbi:response regulator [Pedobacter suwonensis]|uniref:response regulator n=1 Tax=Pedobacter suwonensis TaxID=332999 RepID=UPI00368628A9